MQRIKKDRGKMKKGKEHSSVNTTAEVNVTMLRNGKYVYLLRIAHVGDDFYVHLISDNRDKHPTYDGVNVMDMHLVDHISYHQDGTVHLKHKKGKYSKVSFQIPQKFLALDDLFDMPLLAISFYEKGFEQTGNGVGKILAECPEDHKVIESCNITFTVALFVRDIAPKPKVLRCIETIVLPGGFVPDANAYQVHNIPDGSEVVPKLLVGLNPSSEQLRNDLTFFDKSELDRIDRFMSCATTTHEPYRKI